jgi:DNA polymerase-3 subunit epsilon
MRQIVLDTETTGLEVDRGHRIIEIGCVELLNRRTTGRYFHRYLNPEREIEQGARAVHGLTRARLAQEPKFAEIASELLQFIEGSELIIHNAVFDIAFLEREFALLETPAPILVRNLCQILDTLSLARERHPGQRNSLDALCKRYGIDNSHRELHGALLDARILADVYLAMTGGQSLLALDESARERASARTTAAPAMVRPSEPLVVIPASAEECAAHAELLALLAKSSGGRCVWSTLESTPPVTPMAE